MHRCVALLELGNFVLESLVVLHELALIGIKRSAVRLIAAVGTNEIHLVFLVSLFDRCVFALDPGQMMRYGV